MSDKNVNHRITMKKRMRQREMMMGKDDDNVDMIHTVVSHPMPCHHHTTHIQSANNQKNKRVSAKKGKHSQHPELSRGTRRWRYCACFMRSWDPPYKHDATVSRSEISRDREKSFTFSDGVACCFTLFNVLLQNWKRKKWRKNTARAHCRYILSVNWRLAREMKFSLNIFSLSEM